MLAIVTVEQLRRALRQHRLEQNFSLEDLARAIGPLTGATVKRFIDGTTEPHETTVYAVRAYLKGKKEVA